MSSYARDFINPKAMEREQSALGVNKSNSQARGN